MEIQTLISFLELTPWAELTWVLEILSVMAGTNCRVNGLADGHTEINFLAVSKLRQGLSRKYFWSH